MEEFNGLQESADQLARHIWCMSGCPADSSWDSSAKEFASRGLAFPRVLTLWVLHFPSVSYGMVLWLVNLLKFHVLITKQDKFYTGHWSWCSFCIILKNLSFCTHSPEIPFWEGHTSSIPVTIAFEYLQYSCSFENLTPLPLWTGAGPTRLATPDH